jgi:hypothetical protein
VITCCLGRLVLSAVGIPFYAQDTVLMRASLSILRYSHEMVGSQKMAPSGGEIMMRRSWVTENATAADRCHPRFGCVA